VLASIPSNLFVRIAPQQEKDERLFVYITKKHHLRRPHLPLLAR